MNHDATWLRRFAKESSSAARLLCIPHAGAGASSFNGWSRLLPPWLELVRVQLPGREDNSSLPKTRMDDLLPVLASDVEGLLDKPLAIYGHCLGALIAFEVARELRRRGRLAPVALFISGRRAPQKPGHVVLHQLPEEELLIELDAMGATSSLLTNARWRRYYLQTIRADMAITDTYAYRHEPPLPCPLHMFIGEDDPRKEEEGWPEQTAGEYRRHRLAGGHFFSKEGLEALVAIVASVVGDSLDRLARHPVGRGEAGRTIQHAT